MSLYKHKRVTCIFIDSDKRVYRKRVTVVDGFAAVAFNGKTCVYDVGSSTFTPPTFKVGCTKPLTGLSLAPPSYMSPAYYNMFNTSMMISANRKGRAVLLLNTFSGSDSSLRCVLLDCIDSSLHQNKFVLVPVNVLKGAFSYDYAIEKGVVEGDFVVFTDEVVAELRNT